MQQFTYSIDNNNSLQNYYSNIQSSEIDIISLFSGAGGMDIGFERAGFTTIWANENDKNIVPSYKNYFKNTRIDTRSITDIPSCDIPKAVGVIGGPPCQSWSEAGARRGMKDSRGLLFNEYIRAIEHTKPLFFVAENVHGLIHQRNKESFDYIIDCLSGVGYRVSWALLNASDYMVPQDRKRVFIVGYHKSLNKIFNFPVPYEMKVTLRDAIGDLCLHQIGTTANIKNHELSKTGYSPIFMSRNRVRSWEEQSFTILACDRHIPLHPQAPKMLNSSDKLQKEFVTGYEHMYRRFTIRECARIQTFPDEYEFLYSNIRDGYKMVGNAVPVNLAYTIAAAIVRDLITE